MKSVQQTFVFDAMNKGGALNSRIMEALKDAETVELNQLVAPLAVLSKSVRLREKDNILRAVEQGKIKMVLAPANKKLPPALPWLVTKTPAGLTGIVFLDTFGRKEARTGMIDINPMQLYMLLHGAYIGMHMFDNYGLMTTNYEFISRGANIYANMFIKVLNKKYALNTDPTKMNRMLYLAAKFFLLNLAGLKQKPGSDTVNNIALKLLKNPNIMDITNIDEQMPEGAYENFGTFISAIISVPELEKSVPGLTTRGFLERFISMYDGSMVMALENITYFTYHITGVTLAAYINSQFALDDICEKDGPAFLNASFKIFK